MQQKRAIQSVLVILTFFFSIYGKKALNSIYNISFSSPMISMIYGYLWWLIPPILLIGILYGFRNIFKEFNLDKNISVGFYFALISTLPMIISSYFLGEFDKNLTLTTFLHYTIIGAFMEEFLFRGFIFGILFRKLKWGFIPASMLGGVVFGIGHLYQGSNFLESFSVFIVTFIGALWFAWLFIEWKENLWIPIFLHIFMNLSWTVFNVGINAAGDSKTNVFRTITIILTIILTIVYNKKTGKGFTITKKKLLTNNT